MKTPRRARRPAKGSVSSRPDPNRPSTKSPVIAMTSGASALVRRTTSLGEVATLGRSDVQVSQLNDRGSCQGRREPGERDAKLLHHGVAQPLEDRVGPEHGAHRDHGGRQQRGPAGVAWPDQVADERTRPCRGRRKPEQVGRQQGRQEEQHQAEPDVPGPGRQGGPRSWHQPGRHEREWHRTGERDAGRGCPCAVGQGHLCFAHEPHPEIGMNAGQDGEREKKEGDEPVEQRRALQTWCFSAASRKRAMVTVDASVQQRSLVRFDASGSTSRIRRWLSRGGST